MFSVCNVISRENKILLNGILDLNFQTVILFVVDDL